MGRLEHTVAEIQDSDTFRRYLDVQARFYRNTWRDVGLILAQRRDATLVAGYVAWQKMGRTVRRGEKGIGILVPMRRRVPTDADETTPETQLLFGVGRVFDISQTDGRPLPEVQVPVLAGEEGALLFAQLETLAWNEQLTVTPTSPARRFVRRGALSPSVRGAAI